ncbi:MAG: agmatinase [Kiritimatiellae bacterium]|nr:agmatinase [Kiritimatiellia bacterium]
MGIRMMQAQTNQFIGCDVPFEDAKVVLFGAPYDSTTSFRPGTRFGPNAMRMESFGIETYSMLLDKDLLDDTSVFDSGDIELPFGNQEQTLAMIEARADEIVAAGKIPFLLGGEHLVTLGSVRAVAKKHPDLRIVHFDAHADLREDYLGNPLSHACVLRRCHDLLGDGRIFQFGIRSGTREERRFMRDGHVTTELFADTTLDAVLDAIGPDAPVYLTVDMDVLDPSEFPGTGTQEAGGFRYPQLVADVRKILAQLNVVGLDNVELNPGLDSSGRSTALACKFLREELLSLRV